MSAESSFLGPESELHKLKLELERCGSANLERLRPQVEAAIERAGHRLVTGEAEVVGGFEPVH